MESYWLPSSAAGRAELAVSDFTIDWDGEQVTCLNGAVSSSWRTEKSSHGKPVLKADFRKKDCLPCPLRARCTSSVTNARKLTLRSREPHELLERLRAEHATEPGGDDKARPGSQRRGWRAAPSDGLRYQHGGTGHSDLEAPSGTSMVNSRWTP